jgi:hypothetical protein
MRFGSSKLHRQEREKIVERRKEQFTGDPSSRREPSKDECDRVKSDLVGLALSGGGIRSASFNLGLLQALHLHGLIRFIDYLSSVSGGSYVCSLFASSVVRKEQRFSTSSFVLACDKSERQPPVMLKLIRGGNYLVVRFARFANEYLIGLVLNNLVPLSLLVAVCAALAFLWRCLDYQFFRDYLSAFGFGGDVAPAMLPGCALFLIWFATWILALVLDSRQLRRASYWILGIAIGGTLIGLAVLGGNGDITVSGRGSSRDVVVDGFLTKPLVIAIIVGLVPVLLPKRLLRSGVRPRNIWESWVFYYTSAAILIGVPMLLISLFAAENISGYGKQRSPEFAYGDLKDARLLREFVSDDRDKSEVFAETLTEPQAEAIRKLAVELSHRQAESAIANAHLHGHSEYQGEITARVKFDDKDENYKPPEPPEQSDWPKWKYILRLNCFREFVLHVLGSDSDHLTQFINSSREARRLEDEILTNLNEQALRNPKFFRHPSFKVALENAARSRPSVPPPLPSDEGSAKDAGTTVIDQDGLKLAVPSKPDKIDELLPASDPLVVLARKVELLGDESLSDQEVLLLNRLLLERQHPDWVRSRDEIRRVTVIEKDQLHRAVWAGGALVVFLVAGAFINPNRTSVHEFYRKQLSSAYLGDDQMRLDRLTTHRYGAPYPLILGSVNKGSLFEMPQQLEPPLETFVFSPLYCGCNGLGYQETKELLGKDFDVGDAVAISSAAFTPSFFVNHLAMVVLTILNLRLGQWLPNPKRKKDDLKPRVLKVMRDMLRPVDERRFVFVSDGGHHENLGMGELLDRRCALIIVSDAGQDPAYEFADFAKLIRRYRIEKGIRFVEVATGRPLELRRRFPSLGDGGGKGDGKNGRDSDVDGDDNSAANTFSKCHFFVAQIKYPASVGRQGSTASTGEAPKTKPPTTELSDGDEEKLAAAEAEDLDDPSDRDRIGESGGWLVYIKPSLTGDEDVDLMRYKRKSPLFPHDTTADQAFSEEQFECYRALGFHIGQDLCRNLDHSLWDNNPPQPFDLVDTLIRELKFQELGPPELKETVATTLIQTREGVVDRVLEIKRNPKSGNGQEE